MQLFQIIQKKIDILTREKKYHDETQFNVFLMTSSQILFAIISKSKLVIIWCRLEYNCISCFVVVVDVDEKDL